MTYGATAVGGGSVTYPGVGSAAPQTLPYGQGTVTYSAAPVGQETLTYAAPDSATYSTGVGYAEPQTLTYAALQPYVQGEVGMQVAPVSDQNAVFNSLDANHDGGLTPGEFAALMAGGQGTVTCGATPVVGQETVTYSAPSVEGTVTYPPAEFTTQGAVTYGAPAVGGQETVTYAAPSVQGTVTYPAGVASAAPQTLTYATPQPYAQGELGGAQIAAVSDQNAVFNSLDANHDGGLTPAEFAALMAGGQGTGGQGTVTYGAPPVVGQETVTYAAPSVQGTVSYSGGVGGGQETLTYAAPSAQGSVMYSGGVGGVV